MNRAYPEKRAFLNLWTRERRRQQPELR